MSMLVYVDFASLKSWNYESKCKRIFSFLPILCPQPPFYRGSHKKSMIVSIDYLDRSRISTALSYSRRRSEKILSCNPSL